MQKRTGRDRSRRSKPLRTPGPVPTRASNRERAGSAVDALARVLDGSQCARVVPFLPPETLQSLIRHRGLDACGELVVAATPAQLTSVLDLDLWRHAQSGRDDQFDANRFGEWIEALVEVGDSVAARLVAGLDEQLIIAGLSRYIRVFDIAALAPSTTSDDEPMAANGAAPGGSSCELGGYLVSAIREDAWDAIISLLLALDCAHGDFFHAVMRGCRELSNSTPEIDGLDDLLMAPEQLLHEVGLDREHRMSCQGYSTPADARAFLQMARRPKGGSGAAVSTNPIATAYFREADEVTTLPGRDHVPGSAGITEEGAPPGPSMSESVDAVIDMLAEAGLVPERPRALLAGTAPETSRLTRIRSLMAHLRDSDDNAYFLRNREVAFLANVLMAGCSVQSRPFTPQEASDAAVAVCNLGLEHWRAWSRDTLTPDVESAADARDTLPEDFLVHHDLVTAFEVGWSVLHRDVSMFVADELLVTLSDLESVDPEIREGLHHLRRELVKHRDAHTPWGARGALDVLAMLDMASWAGLLGLLDECPVIPAALTATLERRPGAISPTAFEFISTAGQIRQVRAFMGRLLETLSQ